MFKFSSNCMNFSSLFCLFVLLGTSISFQCVRAEMVNADESKPHDFKPPFPILKDHGPIPSFDFTDGINRIGTFSWNLNVNVGKIDVKRKGSTEQRIVHQEGWNGSCSSGGFQPYTAIGEYIEKVVISPKSFEEFYEIKKETIREVYWFQTKEIHITEGINAGAGHDCTANSRSPSTVEMNVTNSLVIPHSSNENNNIILRIWFEGVAWKNQNGPYGDVTITIYNNANGKQLAVKALTRDSFFEFSTLTFPKLLIDNNDLRVEIDHHGLITSNSIETLDSIGATIVLSIWIQKSIEHLIDTGGYVK